MAKRPRALPLFADMEREHADTRYRELLAENTQAMLAVEAADAAWQPHAAAFWQAHHEIAELHAKRASGEPIGKADILAAYDRRMLAGCAQHPYRKRLNEARAWKKAVELALNGLTKGNGQ